MTKTYYFYKETVERIYELLDQIGEDFDQYSIDQINLDFRTQNVSGKDMVILTATTD